MKSNTPGSRWWGPRAGYAINAVGCVGCAVQMFVLGGFSLHALFQLAPPGNWLNFDQFIGGDSLDAEAVEARRSFRLLIIGIAVNLIVGFVFLGVSWLTFRRRLGYPRYRVRPDSAFCGECGYDHAHLTDSANCPECGLPVGFWQNSKKWPRRLRREVSRLGPHEYARRFGIPACPGGSEIAAPAPSGGC